jgi:hypothetical protein
MDLPHIPEPRIIIEHVLHENPDNLCCTVVRFNSFFVQGLLHLRHSNSASSNGDVPRVQNRVCKEPLQVLPHSSASPSAAVVLRGFLCVSLWWLNLLRVSKILTECLLGLWESSSGSL